MQVWRRISRREGGAAAVEFALVLPLFLLLIAGVVDFGRAFFTEVTITNAAREGARSAMMPGSAVADAQARAAQATGNDPTLTYSITVCATSPSPTDTAVVTVTKPNFQWIMLGPALAFFGGSSALPTSLTGKAVMKCGG